MLYIGRGGVEWHIDVATKERKRKRERATKFYKPSRDSYNNSEQHKKEELEEPFY